MSECNFCSTCSEYDSRIGRNYETDMGGIATLLGIVWAEDDLYYIMSEGGKHTWVSCVLLLESAGYELIEDVRHAI